MNFKKGVSLALAVTLLGSSTLAFADGKEEVIYAVLNAQGQVDGLYAVNIFEGGDIVDYGDYASVHPLNTEDRIAYENGEVRFHSDAQRVYYQGNLNTRDLPWLFQLTYRLDGQEIAAGELAGKSGHVEIELDVRQNPAYDGELFKSHALQISAALDTEKCRNITAEGATQANVGTSRQLSYIVLPSTEKSILISTDATNFEMDAISINGVRLSLDIDVDDSELTEQTDKIIDAGVKLDDGAQELLDGASELAGHNAELMDGAQQIVDAIYEAANDTLDASKNNFSKLGITLRTLTSANYSSEIARLQSELLENVDDYLCLAWCMSDSVRMCHETNPCTAVPTLPAVHSFEPLSCVRRGIDSSHEAQSPPIPPCSIDRSVFLSSASPLPLHQENTHYPSSLLYHGQ